jgi:hypothetical protein
MMVYYSREWFADGHNDPHWLYWWQDTSYWASKDYGYYWIVPGTHDELED